MTEKGKISVRECYLILLSLLSSLFLSLFFVVILLIQIKYGKIYLFEMPIIAIIEVVAMIGLNIMNMESIRRLMRKW